MSHGFTDWTDLGIFPAQDVEEGVPIGMRMALVAGRVLKRPEAGGGGAAAVTEYAREHGLGTLGDVHPWFFWQTKEREKRAMGSWSQMWGAVVTDSASSYYGGSAGVQPLTRDEGDHQVNDPRYRVVQPAWSRALPWQPEGMLAIVAPSTSETEPGSTMLSADRRLVAANVGGPGQCGTLVVDLQPEGVLCMDGSTNPGQLGRHARLQSIFRVIALPGAGIGGTSGLNSLALNYGYSQQDGILGLGMIYGPSISGGGGGGGGPITQGGSGRPGPITQGGNSNIGPGTGDTNQYRTGGTGGRTSPSGPGSPGEPPGRGGPGFAGPGGGAFGDSGGEGENASEATAVEGFGRFSSAARGGHAIGLMSALASGPIMFGCTRHVVGTDRDGHLMTPAHITTNTLVFDSPDRDGPFLFEGEFPRATVAQVPTLVHLSWDRNTDHTFVGGTRPGKWRWWTSVPYVESEEDEGKEGKPTTPGTPSTPSGPSNPSSPSTPGVPSGPGAGAPGAPNSPIRPGSPVRPGSPTAPNSPIRPGSPPPAPKRPWRPGAPAGTLPPTTGDGSLPSTPATPPRYQEPPDKTKGPIRPGPGPGGGSVPSTPLAPAELHPIGDYAITSGSQAHSGRGTNFQRFDLEETADEVRERGGPAGVITHVGGSARGRDVGLYGIFHPFNNGFAAIAFRPQLWIKGAPNFEHNPLLSADVLRREERTRPSTVTVRAWGAQNNSGDWSYVQPPVSSRARGGTVNGGLLFAPSEFEMEDYLGINSVADTSSPSASTYVTFAPKVRVTFGLPTTSGHPSSASKVLYQASASGELIIAQVGTAGALTSIMKASVNATDTQPYVEIEGTRAVRIPAGEDSQRPTSPAEGDLRVNTTTNNLEYYAGGAWRTLLGI